MTFSRRPRLSPPVRLGAMLLMALMLSATAPASAAEKRANEMSFETGGAQLCPAGCILAVGEFTGRAASDFARFLRTHPGVGGEVVFSSPGGDLVDALKLGLLIRRAGLATRVDEAAPDGTTFIGRADCASACAYAFLGGVRRTLPPHARLGLHQFAAGAGGADLGAAEAQKLVGVLTLYLQAVDVDRDLILRALMIPPNRIHWLTTSELVASRVLGTEAVSFASAARASCGVRRSILREPQCARDRLGFVLAAYP